MKKVLVLTSAGPMVFSIPAGRTAADVAARNGVTKSSSFKEFDEADFDAEDYYYSQAFSLSRGVVSFDLEVAKTAKTKEIDAVVKKKLDLEYGAELERVRVDASYTLSQAAKDAIKAIYATRDAAVAAMAAANSSAAISGIKVSSQGLGDSEFEDNGSTVAVAVASSSVDIS